MSSVYISELITIPSITNDDFFPLVESASLTTYRTDFNTVSGWMSSSVTASHATYALTASMAKTASFAISASRALTASYLLYQGFPNGTASYALTASRAISASYVNVSGLRVGFATYALSASWASSSVSSSYITASNIDGVVTSASYAITASHAINADFGISASYALSASYSATASHALYAETTVNNPVSIYGPFTSSMDETAPVVEWSRWDHEKRAVAFTLAGDADVLVECTVNYAIDEESSYLRYIAGIIRPRTGPGSDNPLVDPPSSVSAYDDFKFVSVYDFEANARIDTTTKLYIRKISLTTGTYVLYLLPFYANGNISPWGTSGVAQKTVLDDFLAAPPLGITDRVRFYKFANSVTINVYSTTLITQAIL